MRRVALRLKDPRIDELLWTLCRFIVALRFPASYLKGPSTPAKLVKANHKTLRSFQRNERTRHWFHRDAAAKPFCIACIAQGTLPNKPQHVDFWHFLKPRRCSV